MAAITTNTGNNPHLARVYNIQSVEDCRDAYDDWAATFESDVLGPAQDYVAPRHVAEALVTAGANLASGEILDAGCGTGLSGVALVTSGGAKHIDGLDLSPGMLKVAEKAGIYRSLRPADLSQPIPEVGDGRYDVVVCVGTLTHGHVKPAPALGEFVRVVNKGGFVAATVLDDIWVGGGYEAEVESLVQRRLVEVVSNESKDYRKAANVSAKILVLRKL